MRPKTREMTQHGGPPGWLDEGDQAWWDLCCDGWSMPPSLTDRTTCPGLKLLSCELLANPADVDNALNVHKTPSWALSCKEGMGQTPAVSLFCSTHSVMKYRNHPTWRQANLGRRKSANSFWNKFSCKSHRHRKMPFVDKEGIRYFWPPSSGCKDMFWNTSEDLRWNQGSALDDVFYLFFKITDGLNWLTLSSCNFKYWIRDCDDNWNLNTKG